MNGWFDAAWMAESLRSRSARDVVAEVYRHLQSPVYSYLHATVGSRVEAEDLTQEVFVRLHQELQRGKAIRNLRSWMFSVAHNLAMDACRRETHRGVLAEEDLVQTAGQERDLIEGERNRKMTASLQRLSPRERQCLELRAEGLRYREIADVLQVSVASVQSFLARAVSKLKEEL